MGLEFFEIEHVYKEGNMVADTMATLDLQMEGMRCLRKKDSLPRNAQLLLRGECLYTNSHG